MIGGAMEGNASCDPTSSAVGELGDIDRLDLHELALQHRDAYQSATPFPHILLEGLFDPDVVARARSEELGPGLQLVPRRSNRIVKAESTTPAGPTATAILDRLLADDVTDMLTTLSGISDLITDPTHWWGGVHVLAPGSFQAVHRDFAHDATGDLWHRINILVYLNPGWQPEWGGQLELWDPKMTACQRQIDPAGGRVMIFEPGPDALHGIPSVVRCPDGEARITLASYYYTTDPGPHAGRHHSAVLGLPRRPGERRTAALAIPKDPFRRFRERRSRPV
jgi:2OG-Fe(II) oxygenase superfamily